MVSFGDASWGHTVPFEQCHKTQIVIFLSLSPPGWFLDVFNVLQVRPLTRVLHQFNLAWNVSKLEVLFAALKSEIEAIVEDNGVQKGEVHN